MALGTFVNTPPWGVYESRPHLLTKVRATSPRGGSPCRPADHLQAASNTRTEPPSALKTVMGFIGERAFYLRNAGRTALMLELERPGLNRAADELVSSRHRNYLVAGGSPGGQMSIRDRKGQPSPRP